MRGRRAFVILTIHVLVMSAFVTLLYTIYAASANNAYSGIDRQMLGKIVFGGVVGMELLLVCFITPAFTVGAVSGERERQTYDLLRTTLLSSSALVLGKLAALVRRPGLAGNHRQRGEDEQLPRPAGRHR